MRGKFVLTIFWSTLVPLIAAVSAAEEGSAIALTGARLIDGTGPAPIENATLVIQGNRISAAGPADSVKRPEHAEFIDCHGQTIIPGLISSHSHIGLVDGVNVSPANYNRDNIQRQLLQYEAFGVTTVMALGLNADLFYTLRDEQRNGRLPGADMFGADRGIGAPLGAPPNTLLPVGTDQLYRPETPDEAKTDVREMAARHPDLIKIWVDDLLNTAPKMKPEIYQAVIEEAHRLGLRVASHIYYLDDAKAVLNSGVDIIAHGVRDQPVDAEFIAALKARSAYYIPTINLDECSYIYSEQPAWMKEPFFQAALQPALRVRLSDATFIHKMRTNPNLPVFKAAVANNKKNLKMLFDAGVNIAMGTDSGAQPLRILGFAEHRELQLMVESGLTPMQALQCATHNSAAALGLSDRGVLAPGKLADFVVLAANPLEDIKNTEKIAAVWHNGKQVHGPIVVSAD